MADYKFVPLIERDKCLNEVLSSMMEGGRIKINSVTVILIP